MIFIYRLLINLVPFIVAAAGYWFMFGKAVKNPNKITRAIALVLLSIGACVSAYQFVVTIMELSDNSFNFLVIIFNVIVWAITAIVMALGEKEN